MTPKRILIVRGELGDFPLFSAKDLVKSVGEGQCKMGDFVFDVAADKWFRIADHEAMAGVVQRPALVLERRLVYFHLSIDNAIVGPLTVAEARDRVAHKGFGENNWVYVDGDTEWRKLSTIRALESHLPKLPTDKPKISVQQEEPQEASPAPAGSIPEGATTAANSGMAEVREGSGGLSSPDIEVSHELAARPSQTSGENMAESNTSPSIQIDFDVTGVNEREPVPQVPRESARPAIVARMAHGTDTAISAMTDPGSAALMKDITHSIPLPGAVHASERSGIMINAEATKTSEFLIQAAAPIADVSMGSKSKAPEQSMPSNPALQPPRLKEAEDFDGITVAISTEPMWLIKQNNSEAIMGPYRFLDVIQFLKAGKFTKDDKISKVGAKRFVRIHQQYEFNVKYSVETVVENGIEVKKIYIRRRHPRVPYMTSVQVIGKFGSQSGNCVNISAGGILMELTKAEMNLGEIVEIKLIPGLIQRSIHCKALIIGKVPKAPPSYALKFEDLKPEDKEAIEYYVQKALNLNL